MAFFLQSGYTFERMRGYAIALALSLVTTAACLPLRPYLDIANIVMLFLFAVFVIATKWGRGPAVVGAFSSAVLFDYFFVPPHMGFIPNDAQYLVTLAVMLVVSLVTTQLTSRLREKTAIISFREHQVHRLYQLGSDLAGAATRWDVQSALDGYLSGSNFRALLQLADDQTTPATTADAVSLHAYVQETLRTGQVLECDRCGNALFFPLTTSMRVIGVMVIMTPAASKSGLSAERPLFSAVASLVAIALERLRYAEIAQKTEVTISAERLRTSLLSSLSHDLRTPLTSLVVQADSLAINTAGRDESIRAAAASIREQAQSMGRLLQNILDMARLQAGKATLSKEWQFFDDVIASSVRQMKLAQFRHKTRVMPAPEPMVVEFDAVLMERVIWNLLENATKYSPAETPIDIATFAEGNHACLSICDYGPGFPEDTDALFRAFERGQRESAVAGAGLGLAICQAIVDAHGGVIEAVNREGGGGCVIIRLPLGTPPRLEEDLNGCGNSL